MIELVIMFVAAHALCDYPLQGDFLAKAKSRTNPIPGVPWWQALGAHSAIHAGAVLLISGVWWMAAIEFVVHFVTDDFKCSGKISYNVDQAIHIATKMTFVALLVAGVV